MVYFGTPSQPHSFRVGLNNRILFHNKRYCALDKKAVILHTI